MRMSVLRWSRWVAKEWRNVWALIRLVKPTRHAAALIALLITLGSTWCRRMAPLRGSVGGGYYIFTIADPGKHIITTSADNHTELEVTVDAGKTYYVEQTIYPGFLKGLIKLSLLDPMEGRKNQKNAR